MVESLPRSWDHVFLTHEEATGKPALLKVKSHETAPKEGDLFIVGSRPAPAVPRISPICFPSPAGGGRWCPGSSWLGPQHCVSCNTLWCRNGLNPLVRGVSKSRLTPGYWRRLPEVVEDPKRSCVLTASDFWDGFFRNIRTRSTASPSIMKSATSAPVTFPFRNAQGAIVATKAKLEERFLNNYTRILAVKAIAGDLCGIAFCRPTTKGYATARVPQGAVFCATRGAVQSCFQT